MATKVCRGQTVRLCQGVTPGTRRLARLMPASEPLALMARRDLSFGTSYIATSGQRLT
jgi:hypothetical protein